jgi:hypothetical protein
VDGFHKASLGIARLLEVAACLSMHVLTRATDGPGVWNWLADARLASENPVSASEETQLLQ